MTIVWNPCTATIVPGFLLWWPHHEQPIQRSDLGVALTTGAIIAFAVLVIQVLVDTRARQDDRHRQAAADGLVELTVQYVPEPATVVLLIGGAVPGGKGAVVLVRGSLKTARQAARGKK